VPAGHAVKDFNPSAPQNAPTGHSTQLRLLLAPVVGRYVPIAHNEGAVVAGLEQYAPAEQGWQSFKDWAPVAGMNVPAAHACGVAHAEGQ
jgi:hypothetical protein